MRLVTGLMPEVPVESASMDRNELELSEGESKKLSVTVLPVNATNKNVTFTSLDPTIVTISQDGTVKGIKAGTTTITCKAHSGFGVACSVTVRFVDEQSVSLNEDEIDMFMNHTFKLSATILPANASDKSLTWTSNNMSVASVASDGTVTAHNNGSATITATASNGRTASCKVRVMPVLPGAFTVSENKQVYFSKGSLMYNYEGFTFASEQYLPGRHFHWSRDEVEARREKFNWDAQREVSDVFFTNDTYTTLIITSG
ncbi:MAG: Ig domain-containing protein [Alistipes sp.]|nr:Ig domain-containing protein [Candidatus Alistipes equi]